MTRISCQECIDLMALVKDNAADKDSIKLIQEHIEECQSCKNEFNDMGCPPLKMNERPVLERIKDPNFLIALLIVIVGTLTGIGLTEGPGLFYNILIMPLVGAIAYLALNNKVYYFSAGLFVFSYFLVLIKYIFDGSFANSGIFNILLAPIFWSFIYSVLTLLGMIIAFSLKFAFRRGAVYKKGNKIVAGLVAVTLISAVLFAANGLLGNPLSKVLAKQAASRHILENYPHLNLQVEKIDYNFKTGGYYALLRSSTRMDSHFDVDISLIGKVLRDSYKTEVLSGWNTYQRINSEYRMMTDKIFDAPDYPYISHIDFGSLKIKETGREIEGLGLDYGIDIGDLELDKKYDVKELAKTTGYITVYIQDEEVTVEKASEILLGLRKIFDQADVPFYTINFVLQKPRDKDGGPNESKAELRVDDFLYIDIYREGLEERIAESARALEEYYKIMDRKNRDGI